MPPATGRSTTAACASRGRGVSTRPPPRVAPPAPPPPPPPLRPPEPPLKDDLAFDIALEAQLTVDIDALILRRHRVRSRIAFETRRRQQLASDPATARERVGALLPKPPDVCR